MAQALITVNGTPGSNTDLPIDTLVSLSNQNTGGEVSYLWTILDQPEGAADTLSSATVMSPTFTPKKEGTYLLRLVVNAGPGQLVNQVVCAVRHLKSRIRVPAAGETTEASTSKGWAGVPGATDALKMVDAIKADPGIVVVVAGAVGLAINDVVQVSGRAVLKLALPGQEIVPSVTKAPATSSLNLDKTLLVVLGEVSGGPISSGSVLFARRFGQITGLSGVPVVGDPVYVSDTATLALVAGTNIRKMGTVIQSAAGLYEVYFDGAYSNTAAAGAPINAPYLTNGSVGGLSAEVDVTALTADLVFQAGSNAIVPLSLKWFSVGQTGDMLQTRDDTGLVLVSINKDGSINQPNNTAHRWKDSGGTLRNYILFNSNDDFLFGDDVNCRDIQHSCLRAQAFETAGFSRMRIENDGTVSIDTTELIGVPGFLLANSRAIYGVRFIGGSPRKMLELTSADVTTVGNSTDPSAINGSLLDLQIGGSNRWRLLATGELAAQGANRAIQNVLDPVAAQDAATKVYVDTGNVTRIKVDGSLAFTADQSMGSHKLTNVTDPAGAQDAATKAYVDTGNTTRIKADGTIAFSGAQSLGGFQLNNVADPTNPQDAVTANYLTGRKIRQSLNTRISADPTTTTNTDSPPTVVLLTQAITTVTGSQLAIRASFSCSNTNLNQGTNFTIVVDGTLIDRSTSTSPVGGVGTGGAILAVVTGLAAGAHTVELRWRTTANTSQIRPNNTNYEHASLTVQEFLV